MWRDEINVPKKGGIENLHKKQESVDIDTVDSLRCFGVFRGFASFYECRV